MFNELLPLPKIEKHFVLSQYAISTQSKRQNYRKWSKTSFLALWIIEKCILVIFEWSSRPDYVALCWKTFSTITICIIKSIQQTKLQKMAKKSFWIIQKCNFVIFEWSSISDIMAKLLTPFSLIRICNIKLTGWTKLEKMANSTPGGDLHETFLKNQHD